MSFLDCNGALIPYSYEPWKDEGKRDSKIYFSILIFFPFSLNIIQFDTQNFMIMMPFFLSFLPPFSVLLSSFVVDISPTLASSVRQFIPFHILDFWTWTTFRNANKRHDDKSNESNTESRANVQWSSIHGDSEWKAVPNYSSSKSKLCLSSSSHRNGFRRTSRDYKHERLVHIFYLCHISSHTRSPLGPRTPLWRSGI